MGGPVSMQKNARDERRATALRIWVVPLALFAAVWPMIYNHFPLVYDDTGVYLGSPGHLFKPFPHFYTAFVFGVTRAAPLQGVVWVQGLLATAVIAIALARLSAETLSWKVYGATACLFGVTQLPWLVSMIMPDFLLGIGLIALLTLMVKLEDLPTGERSFFFAVALGAAICATANGLVMLVVVCALLLLSGLRRSASRAVAPLPQLPLPC